MKRFLPLLIIVGLFNACSTSRLATTASCPQLPLPTSVSRMAFGSCNDYRRPMHIWNAIARSKPDVFVWMGDAIYPDLPYLVVSKNHADRMERMYEATCQHESYRTFAERVPIVGMWDDHDYGANNVRGDWPFKQRAQELFLDFIGEPAKSERRAQKGIYTDYVFGEKGKQIHLILLDIRYERGLENTDADILGEAQWEWLEKRLKDTKSEVTVVVSGSNILPDYEYSWQRFPRSRARLLDLLNQYAPEKLLLLSGDRHFAELSTWKDPDSGRIFVEAMSSGLTHAYPKLMFRGENNVLRHEAPYLGRNFGLLDMDWATISTYFNGAIVG